MTAATTVKDQLRSIIPAITEVTPEVRSLLKIAPNQSIPAMGLLLYGGAEIESKGGFFGGSQRRKVIIVCTYTSIYICDAKKGTAITLFPHKDVANITMMSQRPPTEVPGNANQMSAHQASPNTSVLIQNTDKTFVAFHFPKSNGGSRVGCSGAELVQLVQRLHDETHRLLEESGDASDDAPPLNVEMRFDPNPADCIKALKKQATKEREAAKGQEGPKSPRDKLRASAQQLRREAMSRHQSSNATDEHGDEAHTDKNGDDSNPHREADDREGDTMNDEDFSNPQLCGSLQIAPDSIGLADSPETTPRNRAHSNQTEDNLLDPNAIVTSSDPAALGDPTVLDVADPYAEESVYAAPAGTYAGIPAKLLEGHEEGHSYPVTAEDKEREALEAFYKSQAEDDNRKQQKEMRKLAKSIAAAAELLAKCEAEEERKRKKILKRRIKGVNRRYEKLDLLLHGELEDIEGALAEMRAEEQAEEAEEDGIEKNVENRDTASVSSATKDAPEDGAIGADTLVDYNPPEPLRSGSEGSAVPPAVRETILASMPAAGPTVSFLAAEEGPSMGGERRTSLTSVTRQPSQHNDHSSAVGRTHSTRSQASVRQSSVSDAHHTTSLPPLGRSGSSANNNGTTFLDAYGLGPADAAATPFDMYARATIEGVSVGGAELPMPTKVRMAHEEHKRTATVTVDPSFFEIPSSVGRVPSSSSAGRVPSIYNQRPAAVAQPSPIPKSRNTNEDRSQQLTLQQIGGYSPQPSIIRSLNPADDSTTLEILYEKSIAENSKLKAEMATMATERNEAIRMLEQFIANEERLSASQREMASKGVSATPSMVRVRGVHLASVSIGVQVEEGLDEDEAEALAIARRRGAGGAETYNHSSDAYPYHQHGERGGGGSGLTSTSINRLGGTLASSSMDASAVPTVYERLEEQRRLTSLLSDRCLMLHRAMEREREANQIALRQQLLAQQAQYEELLLQQRDSLRGVGLHSSPLQLSTNYSTASNNRPQQSSASAYVPYATYYGSPSHSSSGPNASAVHQRQAPDLSSASDTAFLGRVHSALGISANQRLASSTPNSARPTDSSRYRHQPAPDVSRAPNGSYEERQREMAMDI